MKNKLPIIILAIFLISPLISAGSLFGSDNYGSGIYGRSITAPTTPGGGGGGGGGGGVTLECTKNQDCKNDEYCDTNKNKCYKAECFDDSVCDIEKGETCWNYQCVKLFDVEIKDFESPIKLEDFFDFTYLIKGMANISGDVIINFWIENENAKVTSGSDTIYLGSFEEKTKTTKLYLPSTAESGVYEFYVEVAFENYKAKSHRIIEIKVDKDKGVAIIKKKPELAKYLIYGLALLVGILALIILIVLLRKINFQKIKEKIFTRKILTGALKLLISFGILFLIFIFKKNIQNIILLSWNKIKEISPNIIKFLSQKEVILGIISLIIMLIILKIIILIIKKISKEKEKIKKKSSKSIEKIKQYSNNLLHKIKNIYSLKKTKIIIGILILTGILAKIKIKYAKQISKIILIIYNFIIKIFSQKEIILGIIIGIIILSTTIAIIKIIKIKKRKEKNFKRLIEKEGRKWYKPSKN